MSQIKLRFVLISLLIQISALAQTDSLSFLHITDLHVFLNQDRCHPRIRDNRTQKQYDQSEAHLRQFLGSVPAKTHSNLVIATGDLIDFFEAEDANGDMVRNHVDCFVRLVESCGVPMLFTLGNHDAFSFFWRGNKMVHTQNAVALARATWIQRLGCFKEGSYYSRTYQVGKTAYRFIFLDDIFYVHKLAEELEVPYVDKAQLQWLSAQLNESNADVEIVFMHIPFPDKLGQDGKPNGLYSVLAGHSSVKLIFAGHHHKNTVTKYVSRKGNAIVQVQTGALTKSTENWRLVKLTEDAIQVSAPGSIEDQLTVSAKQ